VGPFGTLRTTFLGNPMEVVKKALKGSHHLERTHIPGLGFLKEGKKPLGTQNGLGLPISGNNPKGGFLNLGTQV